MLHHPVISDFDLQRSRMLVCCMLLVPPCVAILISLVLGLGQCKRDKDVPRPFSQTLTGVNLQDVFQKMPAHALYVTNTQVHLLNGDSCPIGQHVIVKRQSGPQTFIANVREIIQQVGSLNYDNGLPDGLLVQTVACVGTTDRLLMPRLVLQDEWSFVPLSVRPFYIYFDDSTMLMES